MTIRNRNPRLQGLVGLGAAIDWFTRNGFSTYRDQGEDVAELVCEVRGVPA